MRRGAGWQKEWERATSAVLRGLQQELVQTRAPTSRAGFQTPLRATSLQVVTRTWDGLPVSSSVPLCPRLGGPRAPFLGLCPLIFKGSIPFPSGACHTPKDHHTPHDCPVLGKACLETCSKSQPSWAKGWCPSALPTWSVMEKPITRGQEWPSTIPWQASSQSYWAQEGRTCPASHGWSVDEPGLLIHQGRVHSFPPASLLGRIPKDSLTCPRYPKPPLSATPSYR